MHKLVIYPDDVLRAQIPETEPSIDIIEEAHRMLEFLDKVPHALALAANQVGLKKRVFVTKVPIVGSSEEIASQIFINPRIVQSSGNDSSLEGCLSFPEISLKVKRKNVLLVDFQDDAQGRWRRMTIDGLSARIFQHELDHLDGKLFIDRVPLNERHGVVKMMIHRRRF